MHDFDMQHGRRNRGGGAGEGMVGATPPPQYFANQKMKSFKITTYKSVYSNKDKIGF